MGRGSDCVYMVKEKKIIYELYDELEKTKQIEFYFVNFDLRNSNHLRLKSTNYEN